MVTEYLHAGEERFQMLGDHLLQGHETFPVRQNHESGEDRRDLDPGKPGDSRLGITNEDRQIE